MKMSAKFATWRCVSHNNVDAARRASKYLEVFLGLEDICERLAGFYTQSVAQELDFLDLVICLQVLDVRLNVLSGGELEAFALDGKDL